MSKFSQGDLVVINHNGVPIYPAEPNDNLRPQAAPSEVLFDKGVVLGVALGTTYRYAGQIPLELVVDQRSKPYRYVFVAQDMLELAPTSAISPESDTSDIAPGISSSSSTKIDATSKQSWFKQNGIFLLVGGVGLLVLLGVLVFRNK